MESLAHHALQGREKEECQSGATLKQSDGGGGDIDE